MTRSDRPEIVLQARQFPPDARFQFLQLQFIDFANGSLLQGSAAHFAVVDHAPGIAGAAEDFRGYEVSGARCAWLAKVCSRDVLAEEREVESRIKTGIDDSLIFAAGAHQKARQPEISAPVE